MPLITAVEYPSLTSGTITPMVKLRWARSERAKKLGLYLNLRAAASTRSLVSCGMESATLDRLMTRETVAGERSRCSASFFRLIGLRAACPAPSLPGLDLFVATERSLAQGNRGGKRRYRSGCRSTFFSTIFFTFFSAIDIGGKNVFHTDR